MRIPGQTSLGYWEGMNAFIRDELGLEKTAVAITVNYGLVDTKTLAFSVFESL